MDLFPTLSELTGVPEEPAPAPDGRSLVPWCMDPDYREERKLVWHYPHYHGSGWRPGSAIRSGPWKLVEFYEDGKIELYDLSLDPGEGTNLRERFPELADSLKRELHCILDEMGASYPERFAGTELE
jgi:arylsulfatase A-like enzyme